jgi:hypothetical protein
MILMNNTSPKELVILRCEKEPFSLYHKSINIKNSQSFSAYTTLSINISIARDPVKHELTKHIVIDASFVRSSVHDQFIALQYMHSQLHLADFYTKARTRA